MVKGQLEPLPEHAEGKEVAQGGADPHGQGRPAGVPCHARTAHQLDAAFPGGGELEGGEPGAEAPAAEKVVPGVLDPARGKVSDEQHEAEIDDENGDHHDVSPSVPLVFVRSAAALKAPPDAVAYDEHELHQKHADVEKKG